MAVEVVKEEGTSHLIYVGDGQKVEGSRESGQSDVCVLGHAVVDNVDTLASEIDLSSEFLTTRPSSLSPRATPSNLKSRLST